MNEEAAWKMRSILLEEGLRVGAKASEEFKKNNGLFGARLLYKSETLISAANCIASLCSEDFFVQLDNEKENGNGFDGNKDEGV